MGDQVAPIRASTQEFLQIEDISDDLVLLTDGSCVLIMETTAVNFGLLSEKEQEALIFAYSGLLNSLNFPVQIYIRSTRKDVSGYLRQLEIAEQKQTNLKLAQRIKSYREFIASTVKEKNVLDKKFYIVLPFAIVEMGVANIAGLVKKKAGLPLPKKQILSRAKTVLTPKKDHLLRQLGRLGLKGTQLTNQKLVGLFHDVYNPNAVHQLQDVKGTTVPLVNKQPW